MHVIVVGAGGIIGSHLVPHLGRMPPVRTVTLIDRDVYESTNLTSQAITPSDVGQCKAMVQARRLRRVKPALEVRAASRAVEDLPLGHLRSAVLLACLDSRIARQYVNQAACRLQIPWIDAGVEGGGWLARVNVYLPGPDAPCLECAWDDRDYGALETTYACSEASMASPTRAPSSLGALAAALQALECQKLLSGMSDAVAVHRQVLIEALHHRHFVTAFRRNPRCRMPDHDGWRIEVLSQRFLRGSLSASFRLLSGRAFSSSSGSRFSVAGRVFVFTPRCTSCGYQAPGVKAVSRAHIPLLRCRRCAGSLAVGGADMTDALEGGALSESCLKHSLRTLGLRIGDVFTLEQDQAGAHYQIGHDAV